jgi:hypothetical protein
VLQCLLNFKTKRPRTTVTVRRVSNLGRPTNWLGPDRILELERRAGGQRRRVRGSSSSHQSFLSMGTYVRGPRRRQPHPCVRSASRGRYCGHHSPCAVCRRSPCAATAWHGNARSASPDAPPPLLCSSVRIRKESVTVELVRGQVDLDFFSFVFVFTSVVDPFLW